MGKAKAKPLDLDKVGTPLKAAKRERFCRLYACDPDTWGNAGASWRKAGFTTKQPRSDACKALKLDSISQRIREIQVAMDEHEPLDATWVRRRMHWLANYNMQDIVSQISVWHAESGQWTIDLTRIPREIAYCIEETGFDSQGRPKIKMVPRAKAIELLARHKDIKAFGDEEKLGEDEDIAVMILRARKARDTKE